MIFDFKIEVNSVSLNLKVYFFVYVDSKCEFSSFPFLCLKDWGSQQKKANRSSEKNKKKLGGEAETRLTNDISPESSPGMGRRKTRTPHTFPHARYVTQMSVPEQAELERLKQRINFSDLDQVCVNTSFHYTYMCICEYRSCSFIS